MALVIAQQHLLKYEMRDQIHSIASQARVFARLPCILNVVREKEVVIISLGTFGPLSLSHDHTSLAMIDVLGRYSPSKSGGPRQLYLVPSKIGLCRESAHAVTYLVDCNRAPFEERCVYFVPANLSYVRRVSTPCRALLRGHPVQERCARSRCQAPSTP